MVANKPRTGDGPLEIFRQGKIFVARIPADGGGRLVMELSEEELTELQCVLKNVLDNEK